MRANQNSAYQNVQDNDRTERRHTTYNERSPGDVELLEVRRVSFLSNSERRVSIADGGASVTGGTGQEMQFGNTSQDEFGIDAAVVLNPAT